MARLHLLLLAGLLLSAAKASAISPATGKPMSVEEASERVRTARAFSIASEPNGGQPTLEERAFLRLLSGPQPARRFSNLAGRGTIGGRMYALLGLKYTAPEVFAARLPKYLRSWRKVPVVGASGTTRSQWVARVAAQIRDADYAKYLQSRGWRKASLRSE